jgi:hypothetical protein
MKLLRFSAFTLIATITFLLNCKKETPSKEIEFHVIDYLGNRVSNASIKLYLTSYDLREETNQVGATQFTDSFGVSKFTNLSPLKYYYLIECGCLTNVYYYSFFIGITPINANDSNALTCVLNSTGSIKFVNNSSHPFALALNGNFFTDIPSDYSLTFNYYPLGSYTLRIVQADNFVTSYIDTTFTGTLTCGSTLTFTYP